MKTALVLGIMETVDKWGGINTRIFKTTWKKSYFMDGFFRNRLTYLFFNL